MHNIQLSESLIPLRLAMTAVVVASILLIGSWFVTIEYLRRDLESDIAVLTRKTDLLTQMRDHARSRAISVHRMVLLEDRFAREDEYLRFLNFGDLFLRARDQFLALPITPREQMLLDGLFPLLTKGKETHEHAIEALQAGHYARAQQIVLHKVIPVQDSSMAALNLLFDAERDATRTLVENARSSYDRFKAAILTLGGALLGACILAVYFFTRREHHSKKDLLNAVEAAKRADALRCEFLARVSHELRTPLTAILGYAELLIEDHGEDRQLLRDVGRIRVSGQHLLSLIDDVLDLSRIESGRYRMASVAIDVSAFAQELAAEIEPVVKNAGNKFAMECAPGISLSTDPRALRQILVNLLSNANKFTQQGSVVLSIERRPDESVAFRVKDTGIGMTDEQLQRVFEPFMHGSAEIATHYGGSGLGLSVVRQLSAAIGARVSVESALGMGTMVTITFNSGDPSPRVLMATKPIDGNVAVPDAGT